MKVTVCFKPMMINDSLTCKCEVNYETVFHLVQTEEKKQLIHE